MSDRQTIQQNVRPLTVLHAAPLDWNRFAGFRISIPELVRAQNRRDDILAALVLTSRQPAVPPDAGMPVFEGPRLLEGSGPLGLPAPFDQPDLVVFHSTYIPIHVAIGKRLRAMQIPYIICPRGGMTRHAQHSKWWKKRLGNLLFFNRLVRQAVAVQYLTQGEATASRDWNTPHFIVGNGIGLPAETDVARPGASPGLRLVFVGRLAIAHKGLDLLLEACALLRRELRQRDARLELYGPDHEGGGSLLEKRIAALNLQGIVRLGGPVRGEAKTALLRQTDVFLHTSRWEGHPMAVLEALAHGVPCLLTAATNMAEDVVSAGAGWQVELSSAGIAAGLKTVLDAPRATLQQAGAHARQLVFQHYTWEEVARRSVDAYRQCLAEARRRVAA